MKKIISAIAFEKRNGKYLYFSKEGTADHGPFGETLTQREIYDNFNQLWEALRSRYEHAYILRATAGQIERGIAYAESNVSSFYSVLGGHCSNFVMRSLMMTYGIITNNNMFTKVNHFYYIPLFYDVKAEIGY